MPDKHEAQSGAVLAFGTPMLQATPGTLTGPIDDSEHRKKCLLGQLDSMPLVRRRPLTAAGTAACLDKGGHGGVVVS